MQTRLVVELQLALKKYKLNEVQQ